MRAEGRHENLHLVIVSPQSEEEYFDKLKSLRDEDGKGPHAWAEAPSVFRTFYDEEYRVKLPPKIGDVILRKGHILYGNGYVGAHNGEELSESLTDLRLAEDEAAGDE
jgi:hypothetical protein